MFYMLMFTVFSRRQHWYTTLERDIIGVCLNHGLKELLGNLQLRRNSLTITTNITLYTLLLSSSEVWWATARALSRISPRFPRSSTKRLCPSTLFRPRGSESTVEKWWHSKEIMSLCHNGSSLNHKGQSNISAGEAKRYHQVHLLGEYPKADRYV